jgi:hypothetical protein
MIYACLTWEFEAEAHLMKLQRLQYIVLGVIGDLHRATHVHDLQVEFEIPYVYNYITKLYMRQAEVI